MARVVVTAAPVFMRASRALAFVFLSMAAGYGCRERWAREDPKANRVVIGGLSLSLPDGFVRKACQRSREVLNIPGQSTEQVFASWEGPREQSFCLFFWSVYPPRDLGAMVTAKQWKTRIAGQETEAAETEMFMGLKQRVFVTWLERPVGGGRFLMYARNVPRETFDGILATMSF